MGLRMTLLKYGTDNIRNFRNKRLIVYLTYNIQKLQFMGLTIIELKFENRNGRQRVNYLWYLNRQCVYCSSAPSFLFNVIGYQLLSLQKACRCTACFSLCLSFHWIYLRIKQTENKKYYQKWKTTFKMIDIRSVENVVKLGVVFTIL